MSSKYPTIIDGLEQIPLIIDDETEVNAASINPIRSAVINIESELGVSPKGDFGSVRARLDAVDESIIDLGSGVFGSLSHADGNFIVSDGLDWTVESGNVARTSLGLGTSDSPKFSSLTINSTFQIEDTSTTIKKDGSGNLTFTDSVVGTITLEELMSAKNIWITSLTQSPGNLTLSGADWNVDYSLVKTIKVQTASTQWSMWLCEDNTFDKTALATKKIAKDINGDAEILLDCSYNPGNTSVYLIYEDTATGVATADILIRGEERRH